MNIKPTGDIYDFMERAQVGAVDGAYDNLTNAQYHSIRNYWSSSSLKALSQSSPASFKHNYILGWPESKQSESMRIGSAVHSLVLEPDSFSRDFAVIDFEVNKRSVKGREEFEAFEAAHKDKIILESDEVEKASRMAESVLENKKIAPYLCDLQREVSIFWTCPFSGLKFRCRPDGFNEEILIELKTTSSAGPKGFVGEIKKYNYDLALQHYAKGIETELLLPKLEHFFVVVESAAPHVSEIYRVNDDMKLLGSEKWLESVNKLESGLVHNQWPGWSSEDEGVLEIGPAIWEMKEWGIAPEFKPNVEIAAEDLF